MIMNIPLIFAVMLGAAWLPAHASSDGWEGFYDRKTLIYWRGQIPPGVEENFREVIWPKLTPEEKQRLGRVQLAFPLEERGPLNFYAEGPTNTVVLPISSMRFFGDIAVALAWLGTNKYSIAPVTDYLAMIAHRPELRRTGRHRPREVLGIPENATSDPAVGSAFQRIFGTAIVYIIGHELGHLYYQHSINVNNKESQIQEEAADRFALELMRRIGDAPVGMVPFFYTLAHLGRSGQTHPLNSSRLYAIAKNIDDQKASYMRTGSRAATLDSITTEVRKIADELRHDAEFQAFLYQRARRVNPDMLGPRNKQ
jgi:hypothetical protein